MMPSLTFIPEDICCLVLRRCLVPETTYKDLVSILSEKTGVTNIRFVCLYSRTLVLDELFLVLLLYLSLGSWEDEQWNFYDQGWVCF